MYWRQGSAVALSGEGNTAIVGGYDDSVGVGAVWILTRSNGLWSQQGKKFVGSGAIEKANQGWSVALSGDGNTAIVGGPGDDSSRGASWIFVRANGIWSQQGSKLIGTGAVGKAGQGRSVSLSGDGNTAIVGGPGDNSGIGAAWVFTRASGVWSQQGNKLVGTGTTGYVGRGWTVSISGDGNTAILGGGGVWAFTRSGGIWTQQGNKFLFADSSVAEGSAFVSGDGNTVIVGSGGDLVDPKKEGAWIFTRSGGVWSQQGNRLLGSGAIGYAGQGISVSISGDGNTALIGGSNDDDQYQYSVGAAWAFKRLDGVWTQWGVKLVSPVAGIGMGAAVSLSSDGTTAIIGEPGDVMPVRYLGGQAVTGSVWMWAEANPNIASIKDIANDQGGKVRVTWNRSRCDISGLSSITSYGLWRRILPGSFKAEAANLNQPVSIANDTLGALYDFVIGVPAVQSISYNVVVPTLSDSMSTGKYMYTYLVTAHSPNPSAIYLSKQDSGYSVDNLAPGTPGNAMLTSLPNGSVKLSWNPDLQDRDMKQYNVYRSSTTGFTVSPSTFLHSTTDTVYTDVSTTPGQIYYYRIASEDIHENLSTPTAELNSSVLSVDAPPSTAAPRIFELSQNYPNPFNPSTTIRFTVPKDGRSTLKIYNTLGEEVATLFNGEAIAGVYHRALFDALKFPSGIYFSRLSFEGNVQARKMLLLK